MSAACGLIQKDTPVGEVLAACPQTVAFFLHHRLDCVGCSMACFCTLEEVCEQYSLEIDWLLAELAAIPGNEQGSSVIDSKGE